MSATAGYNSMESVYVLYHALMPNMGTFGPRSIQFCPLSFVIHYFKCPKIFKMRKDKILRIPWFDLVYITFI